MVTRICQVYQVAAVFRFWNIWTRELAEGNFRKSWRAKAARSKMLFFTLRDLELHGVVSAAL